MAFVDYKISIATQHEAVTELIKGRLTYGFPTTTFGKKWMSEILHVRCDVDLVNVFANCLAGMHKYCLLIEDPQVIPRRLLEFLPTPHLRVVWCADIPQYSAQDVFDNTVATHKKRQVCHSSLENLRNPAETIWKLDQDLPLSPIIKLGDIVGYTLTYKANNVIEQELATKMEKNLVNLVMAFYLVPPSMEIGGFPIQSFQIGEELWLPVVAYHYHDVRIHGDQGCWVLQQQIIWLGSYDKSLFGDKVQCAAGLSFNGLFIRAK